MLPMLGVSLDDYNPNDFQTPVKGNKNKPLEEDASFFSFATANKSMRKTYERINEQLITFYNNCVEATSNNTFETGKELLNFVTTGSKPKSKVPTLIEYAEKVRDSYNTANWLCYQKLINRLNLQASTARKTDTIFATLDIETISTDIFRKWCDYVTKHGWGKDNIKCFRHVVIDYYKNVKRVKFEFDYKPEIKEGSAQANTLSDKELHQLLNVDVDKVTMYNKSDNTHEQKTLYKDILCLLYYCMTRHFDIILARVENFYYENGRMYWNYHAHKTLNTQGGEARDTPIMYQEAVEIIQKYIGNRKEGYLFPVFKESNKGWEKLNSLRTHFNAKLNEFLQDVALTYNWKNQSPTCTTLRHTSFTNAHGKGLDASLLALIGHTSTRQLNRTYFNIKELAKKRTIDMPLLTL